ncbi:MAG: hypothetical protein ACOYVK_03465 [Bacillota bacterium]
MLGLKPERFSRLPVQKIMFEEGTIRKIITSKEDIQTVLEHINTMPLQEQEEKQSIFEPVYRIRCMDKNDVELGTISFIGTNAYFKDKWYGVDPQTVMSLQVLYDHMQYKEVTDGEIIIKEEMRKSREGMDLIDALEGKWQGTDKYTLYFDDGLLKQGDFSFVYAIIETEKDHIYMEAYGKKGLFLKGKKLFELFIDMDETRCNMRIKKVMDSGQIYESHLVYSNQDGLFLGDFDATFFIE